MIFLLKYLLGGIIFMVLFELIKDKLSPQVKLTLFDRAWGVLVWPIMVITFIGALIYYFIEFRNEK